MQEIMKNIRKAEAIKLKDELQYQEGQVVSKTLIQNEAVSITLFSFAKGEEISTHAVSYTHLVGNILAECKKGVAVQPEHIGR